MKTKRVLKILTSTLMIMALMLTGILGTLPTKAEAAISSKAVAAIKLSATSTYLNLGNAVTGTYNFNIDNKISGSKYYWYVKEDKGNPGSVTINKSNGVVTAQEIGTAYIRCRITLPDGKMIRPEAKVTVINNITEVEINNLPENMTMTLGESYDFNRTIINTEGGTSAKTNGITRWELSGVNTAGVTSVSDSGVVTPKYEGDFTIRAVSFENKAKYDAWLKNKDANTSYVTAASEWATITVAAPKGNVEATDFSIMNLSGVRGYNVGFNLIDAKASEVKDIEVILRTNNTILGIVTSNEILVQNPDAVSLSAPVDVFGEFDYVADKSWNYSGWRGAVTTLPTEAEIKVTFKNGVVKTVKNSDITGDFSMFSRGDVEATDFGVMSFSDVYGYNVGFNLIDSQASEVKSVIINVSNAEGVLATAIAKDLFTQYPEAVSISAPIDVAGGFDYVADKSWDYSGWKGKVSDIPTKADIVVIFKNGVVQRIVNTDLTGDTTIFTKGDAETADFSVMNMSEVYGYNVGFNLMDSKASDVAKVEIKVSNENGVLATATTNELLKQYPDATSLSAPIDIAGGFDYEADKSWTFSGWEGNAADVPTEVEIIVTFKNGIIKTLKNTDLTGDTTIFTKGDVTAEDFSVMNLSGIVGYNVGLELSDGKASDVASVEITLYQGEEVLASAVTNELLTQYPDAEGLSAPFDVLGNFDYAADKSWTYSGWNRSETDIPNKAEITVTFKNGIVKKVVNTNLTGDTSIFSKNVEAPVFGVMGYNVNINLVDAKASEVENIVVTLLGAEGELATLTSREILAQNPDAVNFIAPFYVGGFNYEEEKNWTYTGWKGSVSDVPTGATITITFKNGVVRTSTK